MKKIISLYARNYDGDHMVRDEIVTGAEWVISGEGIATLKHDGTSCMVRDGKLYKRREIKPNQQAPVDFELETSDDVTGKKTGWVPVVNTPDNQYHLEAFKGNEPDGTYELMGPRIQGNIEKLDKHVLLPHGGVILNDVPRSFSELKEYMKDFVGEGVVWHHPDGRMVKIKRKDFWK